MARSSKQQKAESDDGIYVYGIVPADVEVEKNAKGIGDPPAKVKVIREGDIAALVSPVKTDQPLGEPEALRAHAQLLDGTASVSPVLPMRFGAVLTDEDAVAEELLRANHDEFASALGQLEGHAEFIIKGRYDEKAILTEVLSESEEARELREDIRAKSEDAGRNSRIALGELINKAIEAKRSADTQKVLKDIEGLVTQVNVREPTDELDAVYVAVLAEVERHDDLEAAVEKLADNWDGRVEMRLRGPLAAYDFVVAGKAGG
jgi:hypothetical protein